MNRRHAQHHGTPLLDAATAGPRRHGPLASSKPRCAPMRPHHGRGHSLRTPPWPLTVGHIAIAGAHHRKEGGPLRTGPGAATPQARRGAEMPQQALTAAADPRRTKVRESISRVRGGKSRSPWGESRRARQRAPPTPLLGPPTKRA